MAPNPTRRSEQAAAAGARTSWPSPERGQRVREAASRRAASGPGSSSSSGTSTNRREVTSGCGSVSRSEAYSSVVEQQHVDVDQRAARGGAAGARPTSRSTALQASEQLLGPVVGPDPQAGVEELGLVEDQPDRLGLIDRRGGQHLTPWPASAARQPEMRAPVTDVRSQARGRRAQRSPGLPPHLHRHLGDGQHHRRLRLGGLDPDGVHS